MLSFSPLALLALSYVVLGGVSATNCTESSGQNVTRNGGSTSRKHRHEFGRPSPRKGHSGSRQSWSYSYSWSETEGGVASGSNVHTIVESASEVVRTVTAPVRTQTAKVTATKQASTKNASKTHKKATATHKASSKKVKSTHKTSAQANATTRATYAASTTKKATTTTKKASSTVAATSTATASSALQSLSLKSHNAARSEYGAGALKWDADLVSLAQTWADGCVWAHGGANGAGQNLAMFSGKDSTIDQAVDMWMDEAGDYDASNPIYSHFTQVVWQATTKLGCAVSYCPTIQGLSYGGNFMVCNYLSAGNVPGQFAENVSKLISS